MEVRNQFYGQLERAIERYDLRLKLSDVAFKTKRNVGYVGQTQYTRSENSFEYFVVIFNQDAIDVDVDTIIDLTIPHEIAHIITMVLGKGFSHDKFWKNICIDLGGKGERTCKSRKINTKLLVTSARKANKRKKYEYIATCGTKVVLSSIRHNKIQKKGAIYRYAETGGKMDKDCEFKEI